MGANVGIIQRVTGQSVAGPQGRPHVSIWPEFALGGEEIIDNSFLFFAFCQQNMRAVRAVNKN